MKELGHLGVRSGFLAYLIYPRLSCALLPCFALRTEAHVLQPALEGSRFWFLLQDCFEGLCWEGEEKTMLVGE